MLKHFPLIGAFSLLLGAVSFFAPGFIFCLILTISIFWLIYKKTPIEERRYLFTVLAAAYILRLAAFIFINYYLFSKGRVDIFGDAADNLLRGQMLAEYIRGETARLPILITLGTYNAHLLTIFNGLFFAFFGYDIVSVKYLNIIFGLVLSWLVYDAAKSIFNIRAARIACATVLFWPTLFLWSIVDLKEIHFVFIVAAIIWSIDKFTCARRVAKRIFFALLILLFSYFLIMLRVRFYPVMATYFILLLLFFSLKKTFAGVAYRRAKAVIFIFIAGALLLIFRVRIFQFTDEFYRNAIAYTRGFLSSGGNNYDLLAGAADTEVFTLRFFISFFCRSVFHFLMEPLPWNLMSLGMAVFFPAMLIWYVLIFFSIRALFTIIREGKGARAVPLLIFGFIYVVSLSMSVPNIGTLIRCRDTIVPIVAMLGSYGLLKINKE